MTTNDTIEDAIADEVEIAPLSPRLLRLATNRRASAISIRRYEETAALMGERAARLQIIQESWFRDRWHRRHKLPKEMKEAVENLERDDLDALSVMATFRPR
jgi:hypothetical protein